LPDESAFVVEARDALPQQGRVTTAQLRGSLRGRARGSADRGRGRSSDRGKGRTAGQTTDRGRGRSSDRGRGRKKTDSGRGRKNKTVQESTTSHATRGRGVGKRRKHAEEQGLYELMFGDEQEEARARHATLPDLNAPITDASQEEVQVTQNAPE
jgi:hypothetical protein